MLNVSPSTAGRCRVSEVWPAETCTSRDFHNEWDQNIRDHHEPEYSNLLTTKCCSSYRVQGILAGLDSASHNTKQNNQASIPELLQCFSFSVEEGEGKT